MNLNLSTHVFAVSSFCTHFFVVHLSSRDIDWSLGMTDHHSFNVPLRLKLPIWCNKHQVLLIDYYFHKSSVFTCTPHPSINSLPTILSRQFILFLSSPQITFYPSFLFWWRLVRRRRSPVHICSLLFQFLHSSQKCFVGPIFWVHHHSLSSNPIPFWDWPLEPSSGLRRCREVGWFSNFPPCLLVSGSGTMRTWGEGKTRRRHE